jgi:hypothetical protein
MRNKTMLRTLQVVSFYILLFVLSISASAQNIKAETITNMEKREAIKIAKLFETKMNSKKDVTLILDDLFVKDFIERYLQGKTNYPIPHIKREVAEKFQVLDLRKYFISIVNFEYLTDTYFLDKFYIGRDGDDPSFEESYPPGVSTIVETIRPQEDDERGLFKNPIIETEKQLFNFIETQDKATKLVRDYLMKHPAMKSKIYRRNLKVIDERRSLLKPSVTICRESCYGFSSGTKLIRIDTVIYQILLVRVDGKLKIINLSSD